MRPAVIGGSSGNRRSRGLVLALAVSAPCAVSCGSATPASPSTPVPPAAHILPSTIMIEETGPSPKETVVAVGSVVAFMNHDIVPHSVAGGAPAARDCPEIDPVGVLMPGETRSTLPFTTAKTCEYHHVRANSPAHNGRIVIR